jgi:signal transduction histidine kinase
LRRPWHIWLVFSVCAAVVLAAMGWVSLAALRLDRAQVESRRLAAFEEDVRLALWRMDSALAPLIAQEAARPWSPYQEYGLPLYTELPLNVLLHFQILPDGSLRSPQVPAAQVAREPGAARDRLEQAANRHTELKGIFEKAALPDLLPPVSPTLTPTPPHMAPWQQVIVQQQEEIITQPAQPDQRQAQRAAQQMAAAPHQVPQDSSRDAARLPPVPPGAPVEQQYPQQRPGQRQIEADRGSPQGKSVAEFQARSQTYSEFLTNVLTMENQPAQPLSAAEVSAGLFKPIWIDGKLLLARRLAANGQDYVQGAWLDWPGIRRFLLDSVADILPAADLEPVVSNPAAGETRLLAALPVRLIPGPLPAYAGADASPIRLSLFIAWGCVLLAAAAVAALLRGAVSLSERRAAFVSAVTHELRTPLTTLRMYAEMLAGDMVPDESNRRGYLHTLQAEADRLGHLVENVLAYSRLERGRANRTGERMTVSALFDRVSERLAARARQSGLTLRVEPQPAARDAEVEIDAAALEQILFNLVDNACKYAASADEPYVHLEAATDDGHMLIRVRDHGPGINSSSGRGLFRPFSKSAEHAAHTAPGVGLGLALCRRLARELGGDLRLEDANGPGACFVIRLPLARQSPG